MISVHSRINIKVLISILSLMILCVAFSLGMLFNINIVFITLSVVLVSNIIVSETITEGNWLTLGTMFSVFWFLYANAHLINEFSNSSFLSGYNLKAYVAYVLALFAFFIGYRLFPIRSVRRDLKINSRIICKLFMFSTGMALVLQSYYYVGIVGFNTILQSSRAYTNLLAQNMQFSFVFGGTRDFLYLATPMLYVLYVRTRYGPAKILAFTTVIFNVTIALLTIDRSKLLFSVIPIGYLLLRDKKVSKILLVIILIMSFLLLIDFKATMSSFINQARIGSIQIAIPEEFFGSFSITTHIMKDLNAGDLEFSYGSTYFETLLAILFPLMDIEPLSIWYVRTFRYDIYSRGGGLAFSSIGEAYMSLGFVSVFVYYFFIGLFVRLLDKRKEYNDFAMIIYSLILPLTYKLFRSEAYSLLKTGVWFWIFPMLIFYILYRRTRLSEE